MSQSDYRSESSVAGPVSGYGDASSGSPEQPPQPPPPVQPSAPPPSPVAAMPPAKSAPIAPGPTIPAPAAPQQNIQPPAPVARPSQPATPPPSKKPVFDPSVVPQPIPQGNPADATGNSAAAPSIKSGRALPPPPPPRSTLSPVRPAPEIPAQVSGVGSAKGPRWRGELQDINRRAEAKEAAKRAALLAAETGREIPPEAQVAEDDEEEQESLTREAPSWLVSTVIHLVLLLIFALITSPAGTGIGKVLLEMGFSEKGEEFELAEFTLDSPVDDSEEDTETNEVPVEVDVMQDFDTVEAAELTELAPTDIGIGPQKVDISMPMFNGRSGAMKKALMAMYGGTPETQNAVELGLEWLAKNQKRDGGWSMMGPYGDGGVSENRCAATAMALLAFLGDGNTHMSGKYKENVDKGMRYLVKEQSRNGFMADNAHSHQRMYGQAQATIALCELYGMTKDSWLRPRAQLAIEFAQNNQAQEGGWRYRYEPAFDSDLSVTGWYVMALKSGQSAGLEVNDSVLRKVEYYLNELQHFDGAGYGYQVGRRPSPAMTAEGLLCRQYLGWAHNHPPMEKGIQALMLDSPFNPRQQDVYYWYYATQTLHHFGGSYWREWNKEMRVELPKLQVSSGKERGSWPPQRDPWGQNAGRIYTTCLSIYCLEVYYRHMPLYKEAAKHSRQ